MKILYFIIPLVLITSICHAQWNYFIDFDTPGSFNELIYIDNISNTNNIWQIGTPSKTVFNSAYSPTKAIMTDTSSVYPINDTSVFYIRHSSFGKQDGLSYLSFYFKIDCDTLTDYGTVDVSFDHGYTWFNLLTDDVTYFMHWQAPKPTLTGSINSWQHFFVDLGYLHGTYFNTDSVYYRFTFISDSNQTNKDGWMLDNFQHEESWEGVYNTITNIQLIFFPNPSKGIININSSDFSGNNKLAIFNSNGQIVFESINIKSSQFDLSYLNNGFYYISYSSDRQTFIQKLIISK